MGFLKNWFSPKVSLEEKPPEFFCKTLIFPRKSVLALQELAELTINDSEIGDAITDPEERSRTKTAKLIQDALRLYEWVIYQQANKKHEILALPADAVTYVAEKFPVDFDKDSLGLMFEPEQMEAAKQYFDKAAPTEIKEPAKVE